MPLRHHVPESYFNFFFRKVYFPMLKNKLLLVTGATSGIGRATAIAAVKAGKTIEARKSSESVNRERGNN